MSQSWFQPSFFVAFLSMTLSLGVGCPSDDDDAAGDDDAGDDDTTPPAAEDWDRDILHTALDVDVGAGQATATITLAGSTSEAASFEIGDLAIAGVTDGDGLALDHATVGDRLDVGVPASEGAAMVEIAYAFTTHDDFDGAMSSGLTFVWPYFCGNLFPCHSDPADGTTFALSLQGLPGGEVAVYPASIDFAAPSYQIAWAVGDFTEELLGTTSAGTEIKVWYEPDDMASMIDGTANLVEVFEWYESTLGPYPFGPVAGAVQASWGWGVGGGMEHHPYWHAGSAALADRELHAHEAGHGWYGGGVRIACWEDFVLSEGTVTYLTARAIGAVGGVEAEQDVWVGYETTMAWALLHQDTIAWPEGCGEVDILEDGLFSWIPYMKGAFFYRAVAEEVGAEVLDSVLASFFAAHVGESAGMQDMLDHIEAETGFDPGDLAEDWLRTLGAPSGWDQ